MSVATVIVGGFALWAASFSHLPLWLSSPIGSVLLTWYGSLQHETIHGHPTSSRRLNSLLGSVPLSLWVPYGIYRQTHIQHHRHSGRRLTEVGHDPESFYLPPGHLRQVGPVRRLILQANCTLLGRIVLGPAVAIVSFGAREVKRARVNRRYRRIWLLHAAGVAAVLGWLRFACHIPLLDYVFFVVYPSIGLTHLRSFAEHRADDHADHRTNVVETRSPWAVLFLNNNLHVAHHAHPHVPWYELPRLWRSMRESNVRVGYIFRGYGEVIRAYLLRPFITAEHPFSGVESE